MRDVVMSLVASVIAGSAVWFGQGLLRYHRVARRRAFFGVSPAAVCLLVAPRHFSSPHPHSVHRRDMAALVELATVIHTCGGRTDLVDMNAGGHGVGRMTEFCVGGPDSNPRTAAHLRSFLPGVRFEPATDTASDIPFTVGSTEYRRRPQEAAYVLLARIQVAAAPRPVFVVAGQTAITNLAAARFLDSRYRGLLRSYGAAGRFCLVLRVVEPETYGPDLVEVEADVTGEAFREEPA